MSSGQFLEAITPKGASYRRMEARGACQLDIVLYSEVMASPALIELLYPLNVLRNAALLMARTELVFILDGDMVISSDLPAVIADPARCGRFEPQTFTKAGHFGSFTLMVIDGGMDIMSAALAHPTQCGFERHESPIPLQHWSHIVSCYGQAWILAEPVLCGISDCEVLHYPKCVEQFVSAKRMSYNQASEKPTRLTSSLNQSLTSGQEQ